MDKLKVEKWWTNLEVKSCFNELSWDFSGNNELCWSDCMPRMMSGRSLCWCRTLCLLLNPHTPSSRTCCGRSSVCPAVTINCSSTGSRCKSGNYLTHQINMFEQDSSWEASGRPACQEIPLLLRNPKFQCRVHNSQPLISKPNQVNSLYISYAFI